MKKVTLIIGLAILFSSWIKSVDVGAPPINAICKIKLKNGEVKEGMICIVTGGYQGYRKNGFGSNFSGTDYFKYELFTVSNYFYGNGQSSRKNRVTGEIQYPDKYFMAAQYDNGSNQISTLIDSTMEHSLTLTTTYNYVALKQFYIYQELPFHLHFPRAIKKDKDRRIDNLKKTKISVDDIDTFELISKPKNKWIQIIQSAREKLDDSIDTLIDYQEPLWYHEIREDTTQFNKLSIELGKESIPSSGRW